MDDEIRGLLPRYYDGELGEDAASKVELHLPGCAACREELHALRALSAVLAGAAEPAAAGEAEALWAALQPKLGEQHAPVPWRTWLPGLLLLTVYALFGLLLTASPLLRLAGIGLDLPLRPFSGLPLALAALEWLPLPAPALSNIFMIGLFGSAGVLYLVWLGFWWSRHTADTDPAHSS